MVGLPNLLLLQFGTYLLITGINHLLMSTIVPSGCNIFTILGIPILSIWKLILSSFNSRLCTLLCWVTRGTEERRIPRAWKRKVDQHREADFLDWSALLYQQVDCMSNPDVWREMTSVWNCIAIGTMEWFFLLQHLFIILVFIHSAFSLIVRRQLDV